MLHLLQMGPSKVLTTSPLQIQNSWQLSLLELSPCCAPIRNTVTSSSDSSDLYTSTVRSDPPLLMLHSRPNLVFKPLSPLCPFCIFFLYPLTTAPCSWLPFYASCFLPQTPSGFFNGMVEVFEPEALNCYIFFCSIPLTLSVFRNPILTNLPLCGFLDSPLCDLIAPTPGLAFSLVMPRTLAAASSCLSGKAYPFLNFLPPLFLCLIPILIM